MIDRNYNKSFSQNFRLNKKLSIENFSEEFKPQLSGVLQQI